MPNLNEERYRGFRWTTGDADNQALAILLPRPNRALHIAEAGDVNTDWDVAAAAQPTLYLHSATTPATDYMSLLHDATNLDLDVRSATWRWLVDGAADFTVAANVMTVLSGSTVDFDAAAGTAAIFLRDVNNNELLRTLGVASAVNQLDVVNAATAASPRVDASGGDTNIGFELRTVGTGWLLHRAGTVATTNGSLAFNKRVLTDATVGAITYTAAQFRAGILERDPAGAARTDTTPTAANIVADVVGAQVGTSFWFLLVNTADAAETITVAAGTGVTLRPATVTVAQNENCLFLVTMTNVTGTSEAVSMIALNAGG